MAKGERGGVGSSFDEFLNDEGLRDEVELGAAKKLLAYQLEEARKAIPMSKTALAAAAGTSRSQVSRVLDPANSHVTIAAVRRVAGALGKTVRLEVV